MQDVFVIMCSPCSPQRHASCFFNICWMEVELCSNYATLRPASNESNQALVPQGRWQAISHSPKPLDVDVLCSDVGHLSASSV